MIKKKNQSIKLNATNQLLQNHNSLKNVKGSDHVRC